MKRREFLQSVAALAAAVAVVPVIVEAAPKPVMTIESDPWLWHTMQIASRLDGPTTCWFTSCRRFDCGERVTIEYQGEILFDGVVNRIDGREVGAIDYQWFARHSPFYVLMGDAE